MPQSEKIKLVDAGLLSGWLISERLRVARPYLTGKVLDFACGHGHLAEACDVENYLGYDIDDRKIEFARQRFPGYQFQSTLPADARFDTVAALAFIEHVEPEPYVKQFADLLNPGGRIVLTTPHPSYEWVHTFGSKLHIFSPAAHDDHEDLISAGRVAQIADGLQLRLVKSQRFLFGANQLFVLARDS